MSDVTNIKTITNHLLGPVTIKNGENTQQTFTVQQGAGWNGDMWIPWVGHEGELWKAIRILRMNEVSVNLFQHGNDIWYLWDDRSWDGKDLCAGNHGIRGEKGL